MREREGVIDDPRFGGPAAVTIEEYVDRAYLMVMDDRPLPMKRITMAISISLERDENILRNELGMTKAFYSVGATCNT